MYKENNTNMARTMRGRFIGHSVYVIQHSLSSWSIKVICTKPVIKMYLIISDVGDNATSSRVSEVFHNGVDVTGLRAAREEKVRRRGSSREGPPDPPEKVCQRRSTREGPPKKVRQRRSA